MLARIIHFKGLVGTTMGTVEIGAGALTTSWPGFFWPTAGISSVGHCLSERG